MRDGDRTDAMRRPIEPRARCRDLAETPSDLVNRSARRRASPAAASRWHTTTSEDTRRRRLLAALIAEAAATGSRAAAEEEEEEGVPSFFGVPSGADGAASHAEGPSEASR